MLRGLSGVLAAPLGQIARLGWARAWLAALGAGDQALPCVFQGNQAHCPLAFAHRCGKNSGMRRVPRLA